MILFTETGCPPSGGPAPDGGPALVLKKKPTGGKKTTTGGKGKATGRHKRSTGPLAPPSSGAPPAPPTPPAPPWPGHGGNTPDHDQARDFLNQELGQSTNLSATQVQEYRDAAVAIIDQTTPTAVQHFNRNVTGYRFFPDLLSLNQYFSPNDPTVPILVTLGMSRLGAYNETARQLELDGPSRHAGRVFDLSYIFSHEFGHAIDGPGHTFSSEPDWQRAWQAEIVPAFQQMNAARSAQEGFSQFARLLYDGRVARPDLEANYPLCVDFWRQQGLW